jgi:predicted MFS family arabinose efflux permease
MITAQGNGEPGMGEAGGQGMSGAASVVLTVVCGLAVANIYFAQPILDVLARALHTSEGTVTLVVTLTQIGYAAGLVLVLPLGDMLENRALTSRTVLVTAVVLAAAGASPNLGVFLAASVLLGLTSVVAHILIPLAAALAPEASRGRVVGRIGSGITLGVLLARTISSLVTDLWGWRAIFFISAALMVLSSLLIRLMLPARKPAPARYLPVLASLIGLIRDYPVLRVRTGCQSLLFAAFSAYWTAIAYELINHHHFSQAGVGLFALVGATGAIALPVSGRLADRGYSRVLFPAALATVSGAMILACLGQHQVVLLALAGVLLDLGLAAHQVPSQRRIFQLRPDARARINGLFMGTVFAGGAVGSALAGILYRGYGWTGVTLAAAALPALGLLWTLLSPAGGVRHPAHPVQPTSAATSNLAPTETS